MRSLILLSVSICLAMSAFFYRPPESAYNQMLRTVAEQPNWNLHAEGKTGDNSVKIDLAAGAEGRLFIRISHPLLKIINNQWIDMQGQGDSNSGIPELKSPDIFSIFHFTDRLFPARHQEAWYDRYGFAASAKAMDFFPDLAGIQGEIWFPFKIFWPWQAPTMLPKHMIISARMNENTIVEFQASMNYAARVADSLRSRPLADALVQLKADGLPKPLIPISAGDENTHAFFNDFDGDGLSDALEMFYGADPSNSDTDNDTFLDGVEVERGYNPAGGGQLTIDY